MELVNRFLIHVDILGFEQLALEVAELSTFEVDIVRGRFIDSIEEKINKLEKDSIITSKQMLADNWLLVVEREEDVFVCLREIINHHTGIINHQQIPLEILIDIIKTDDRIIYSKNPLVVYNETIRFQKSTYLHSFRGWYKHIHAASIHSTFILVTEKAYQELLPISQNIWKIENDNNETF